MEAVEILKSKLEFDNYVGYFNYYNYAAIDREECFAWSKLLQFLKNIRTNKLLYFGISVSKKIDIINHSKV